MSMFKSSVNLDDLLPEVTEVAKSTGDQKLLAECQDLIKLEQAVGVSLDAHASDPLQILEEQWRYMADGTATSLDKVEKEYEERLKNFAQYIKGRAAAVKASGGGSRFQRPTAGALQAAQVYAERIDRGDKVEFPEALEHLKTLQNEALDTINQANASIEARLQRDGETLQLWLKKYFGRRTKKLHRLRWRLRWLRSSRGVARALVSAGTVALLLLLVLTFHDLALELVRGLVSGEVLSFVTLAAVMLVVELVKSLIIEPRVEKFLRSKERNDAKRSFQGLLRLVIMARMEIAKVNAS